MRFTALDGAAALRQHDDKRLPGSPPLGVEADMWVFLWAELAAVLALALLVFKWAKAGPRP